jgi:hypothetical protein
MHFHKKGQFEKRVYTDKYKILMVCDKWGSREDFATGGVMACYNLIKKINELNNKNFYGKMYVYNQENIQNPFCNYFGHNGEINDKTIMIYPDGCVRNDFNAKHVIRWILLELGPKYRSSDFYKGWGKTDLVYHWEKNNKTSEKKYNILIVTHVDEKYKYHINNKRSGSCYLIKKRNLQYSDEILHVHPKNSFCLDSIKSDLRYVHFKNCEYFYCYDNNTFFIIISILTGCKTIIIPYDKNISKECYIENSVFCNFKSYKNFFAYGIGDLNSINYSEEDCNELRKYLNNLSNSVENFLDDMYSYVNKLPCEINTVNSFYFSI